MAFSFDQIFAADPANPSNIAQNASITIFAPGDGTMAPLAITDPDGQPLANPIPVNANGFGSAFAHATLDRVAWAGGGFTGFFTSYDGMKAEAVAARVAAETAASSAAAAATADIASRIASGDFKGADGANIIPTDTAISDAIENPASETRGALNAAVTAKAFPIAVGVPADTNPVSIPVLRAVGDGKTARWEYIHNGGGGYLWHLLAGAGSTNGSWMFGIGLDSGSGGGAIFRNKAAGIGLKVEQLTSISSPTAYGLVIEQRSQAPAVFGEMFTEATAPLSTFVSYKSNSATLPLAKWQGANAKGGNVLAATGVLQWDTDLEVRNAPIRAKGDPTAPQDNQIMLRHGNMQFASYTGSTDQYWHKRIRHGGQSLIMDMSGTTSGGPDGTVSTWYKAFEALQSGTETRLGFYGATPVARPAAITAPTGGTTIDVEARTAINSIRTALTALGITA